MIAAPAQHFNALEKDINIPKAALKLLLDVLLAPDLQEQLSFCIAPYTSLHLSGYSFNGHFSIRVRVRVWYYIMFVAAWVVRSKAATVRYFWITHSCLI